MNWDYTSYFVLLDERFNEMGVLAFRYWSWREEEVYDIYLAEKIEVTVEIFHLYILGELKMHHYQGSKGRKGFPCFLTAIAV